LLVFVVHLPDELSCSSPVMLIQTAGCETCEDGKYEHYRSIIQLSPVSGITIAEALKNH
jgi:hypothetical protein